VFLYLLPHLFSQMSNAQPAWCKNFKTQEQCIKRYCGLNKNEFKTFNCFQMTDFINNDNILETLNNKDYSECYKACKANIKCEKFSVKDKDNLKICSLMNGNNETMVSQTDSVSGFCTTNRMNDDSLLELDCTNFDGGFMGLLHPCRNVHLKACQKCGTKYKRDLKNNNELIYFTALKDISGTNPGSGQTHSTIQISLVEDIIHLNTMLKEINQQLRITNGHRNCYNQCVVAGTYCTIGKPRTALPGTSNHGDGNAIDVAYNPSLYQFLCDCDKKHGFRNAVLSEPWHWEPESVAKIDACSSSYDKDSFKKKKAAYFKIRSNNAKNIHKYCSP